VKRLFAALFVFAVALALPLRRAEAHLLPAGQGTVNVVGAGLFAAVSVPASAFHGADDDGDGTLDVAELQRHEEALRAEADRRLLLFDGATPARTVRVDLVLSPEHDATGGRADRVVVLKHAELDAPPEDLRVRCDLFGARDSERRLTITGTRRPAAVKETEVAELTVDANEHRFFAPPAPPVAPTVTFAPIGRAWGWLVGLAGIAALGLLLGARRVTASHPAR
jgi:hypothetical protein